MAFQNREQAGLRLADALAAWRGQPDLIVLALPRGGVPVAAVVARELHAPLDILVVRKLGHPGQEEYAMGAIASGGVRVRAEPGDWPVSPSQLDEIVQREQAELQRRECAYRGDRPAPSLQGRPVLLVDDGLATGATMSAAVHAVRAQAPSRIGVAVPVASREALAMVGALADEVVCPLVPEPFHAVGLWYRNFEQTSDEEVKALLSQVG
ncbi:phosphoribosyltransferase [Variovorax sp. OV329]|uniref:phosphoribosyltransferase n=1 Tax=Variovorax sp. OV329 TaxID=1882825 RepID=UPI0008EF982C|nr:phosphoribosyltransferase [Variovorax sp. OV329]SFM18813.1 Predicted phosphoribosyltransferase [Variovorax sp. OV329]